LLPPGTRIGPYEIVALLGVGGMGEVYRAIDTNLKRQVAIKVLPATVAADAERLARFQREAEILAALNHPNIAHIHGLEKSDGTVALVMELVEGPTLADRIAKGPIPLDEALPISKQIAEALEAAHEQGIIHRDLKPANIKVREDGTAKVLDFGLAKAMDPVGSRPDVSQSPTITSPAMTQAGVILGTAAYMSPEQAKGRPVDKRADIWAFGCVVYEMLTGKRPFDGEDVSDTLAFVLTKDPDWTALPTDTPVAIRRLLHRCLEKGPRQRLDSAASARLDIEDALKPEPLASARSAVGATSVPARHRARLSWAIAAATSMIAAAAVALWAPWRAAPEPAKVSFEVQADISGVSAQATIALSPDGKMLVALIGEAGDPSQAKLWVRPIDTTTWVPIQGTDQATYPFWSPDSRQIGFISGGKLKTVDVLAPTPQTLVENIGVGTSGGAWSRDGVILFTKNFSPLFRVPASGEGQPVPATELDTSNGETAHRFPRFLPDGDHFLYLVLSAKPAASGIYVGSLTSKGARRLVSSTARADFAEPNLLLFLRESTLMAQRFDPRRLEVLGDPFQVATGVTTGAESGAGGFSVSDNGVLAIRTGGNSGKRQLTWTDATGKADEAIDSPAVYENPRLSPDGKRLAAYRQENGADIWISDLESKNNTRITFDPGVDNVPVWSPDGQSIAFSSNRDGGVFNLYRTNAGGTGDDELLLKTAANKLVNDWTEEFLLYQEDSPQTKIDLWMMPLSGDRKPTRLLVTPFSESEATVSPDGRWMAYTSDESGARQVYVQTFPPSEQKTRISNSRTAGQPRWRSDGKQLFFNAGGTLTVVDVLPSPGGEFKRSVPLELFSGLVNIIPHNFDVADLGRRFLVVRSPRPALQRVQPIVVTVNWTSGLPVVR